VHSSTTREGEGDGRSKTFGLMRGTCQPEQRVAQPWLLCENRRGGKEKEKKKTPLGGARKISGRRRRGIFTGKKKSGEGRPGVER